VSFDLSGGLPSGLDEVTADVPDDPSYREGVSIWLWDDAGQLCFPRIGVEAVGSSWTSSFDTAICLAASDGTLVLSSSSHPPHPVVDQAERPRVLGAGPLRFTCVEPFQHWRIDFDGRAVTTDSDAFLIGGRPRLSPGMGLSEVPLHLEVDARMVLPPWRQGTYEPTGPHVPGEVRFEQHCDVVGTLDVGGDGPIAFRGGGLRVHRKGGDRNDYGDFDGHVWQTARFPSGRAFGFIHYMPGPDRAPRFHEAWVRDRGVTHAARVERTPWLNEAGASGQDVSFVLRTELGATAIEGVTIAACTRPPRSTGSGASFPVLQSAIARYRWGDEEACGMAERSARLTTYASRGTTSS